MAAGRVGGSCEGNNWDGKERRRGRPSKSADARLSATLTVALTTAEADVICERAKRLRVSVSAYIRTQLGLSRSA